VERIMADDDNFKRSNTSRNPTLSPNVFKKVREMGLEDGMTIEGAVNKTGILFLLCVASAAYMAWQVLFLGNQGAIALVIPAAIGGFVIALVVSFVPKTAPFLAPLYAIAEGLTLGAISALMEAQFPGIAVQACGLTLMTLASMLLLYKARLIQATPGFMKGLRIALLACVLMSLVSLACSYFGHPIFSLQQGPIAIVVALVFTAVSTFCLIADFALIERGAAEGWPKFMEWYAAFALMVTLVWLYMNILRLLSLFRKR
jgi:uncharacterized YccA/Bax inhibitor family protein